MRRAVFIIFCTTLVIVLHISGLAFGKDKAKSLEDLQCIAGQIPKFDGTGWVCADDADTSDTSAATKCGTGELLDGDGTCIPIMADTDTSAETECPDGHALLGDGRCVDVDDLQERITVIETKLGSSPSCPCFTANELNEYYEGGLTNTEQWCIDTGSYDDLNGTGGTSVWIGNPNPLNPPKVNIHQVHNNDMNTTTIFCGWRAECPMGDEITGLCIVLPELTPEQYDLCRQEILNSNLWNTCTPVRVR